MTGPAIMILIAAQTAHTETPHSCCWHDSFVTRRRTRDRTTARLAAIWRVAFKTGRGIMRFLQDRLVSYSMVVGVGFLLIVALVVSAVLTAVAGIVGGFLPIDAATAHTLDLVVSFAFITLFFAVIYKFVPDVRIAWRGVWIGAATASGCVRGQGRSPARDS